MTTFGTFNLRWVWTKVLVAFLCVATTVTAQDTSISVSSPYTSTCDGNTDYIADGDCDFSNNNEDCGWDGGDCCECTCIATETYFCTDASDETCDDPDANCDDDTLSGYSTSTFNTPSPSTSTDSSMPTFTSSTDSSYPTFTSSADFSTPTSPAPVQTSELTGSTSDGVSGALIGGICAACVVVLFAVCAGVYCIRARKDKNSAPGKVPSAQYPVPASTQRVQYPVSADPQGVQYPVSAGPQGGGSAVGGQVGSG